MSKVNVSASHRTTKILDATLPFVHGCLSGMTATSVVQPIDMLKVRIQIKNEKMHRLKLEGKPIEKVTASTVFKEIYHAGGVKAFYRGFLKNI